MNSVSCVLDELCLAEEEGSGGGRMSFKSKTDGKFKSKNLFAERRRREKLSGRLLALRALMNKATIVEDAITYIQELQQKVDLLQDQIFEMEASSEETLETNTEETHADAAEEMKKFGIQTEVNVTKIDGNKLWVKAVLEKKRGGFTKLMGAMTALGFELTDTSITTSSGAMMISSCVTGFSCKTLEVEQTRELMLDIINDI
ncbi:hypothetical protein ACFX11_037153 [Malus domestica]